MKLFWVAILYSSKYHRNCKTRSSADEQACKLTGSI
jgi:hypothetical protein